MGIKIYNAIKNQQTIKFLASMSAQRYSGSAWATLNLGPSILALQENVFQSSQTLFGKPGTAPCCVFSRNMGRIFGVSDVRIIRARALRLPRRRTNTIGSAFCLSLNFWRSASPLVQSHSGSTKASLTIHRIDTWYPLSGSCTTSNYVSKSMDCARWTRFSALQLKLTILLKSRTWPV